MTPAIGVVLAALAALYIARRVRQRRRRQLAAQALLQAIRFLNADADGNTAEADQARTHLKNMGIHRITVIQEDIDE